MNDSDSTLNINPTRAFAEDKDKEWRKVTVDSFVKSTAGDITDEDAISVLMDPTRLSLHDLMEDVLQIQNKHNPKSCQLCFEAKEQLKNAIARKAN